MKMDIAALSERFTHHHFPGATAVVLGGSSATGTRTETSDVDLLVLGETDLFSDGRSSLAAAYPFESEVMEVFAYTAEGFDEWAQRGVDEHRPVIVNMLLEGKPIREGVLLSELRARWQPVIDAGPSPSEHELATRRYVITDLLDDLRDSTDALERRVVAGILFERIAELMLLSNGEWLGAGKHLVRRFRAWNAVRSEALAYPLINGDMRAFAEGVEDELRRAGGRVHEGFER